MFEPELLPWRTVRDARHGIPNPRSDHGIADHIFRDGARTYPGHTGSDIGWPAKTIKAGGHGVPGGENMIRYPDGSVRYFTVCEAKRIQTFPDNFVIKGAWGEAMRQIGNAVPVLLGETVGRELAGKLGARNTRIKQADNAGMVLTACFVRISLGQIFGIALPDAAPTCGIGCELSL